ncbi:unnamed protein product [Ilex paraguariensis]|uniref:Uncharacterized protein n=1 Tax=Ilex paraguariensis TaxID=185542 RepID=A0ABC8SRH3_9AQUA
MKMTGTLPSNQETPTNTMFSLQNLCTNSNQPSGANLSHIINSETSFSLESSIQANQGPFQLHTSSPEFCREDLLPQHQLNVDHPKTNLLGFHMGAKASSSILFNTQASELKDNTLEACVLGRIQSTGVHLTNLDCHPILPQQLDGY